MFVRLMTLAMCDVEEDLLMECPERNEKLHAVELFAKVLVILKLLNTSDEKRSKHYSYLVFSEFRLIRTFANSNKRFGPVRVRLLIYKNNETNDKFYPKVAFLMYTEMVNFRPQSSFETKTTPRTGN